MVDNGLGTVLGREIWGIVTSKQPFVRWWVMSGVAFTLFFVVYFLAVRTYLGQYLENSALWGSKNLPKPQVLESLDDLNTISVTSLAIAIVAVGLVGLFRRSFSVAVASAGTIVASVLTTELLKKVILHRPDIAAIGLVKANDHNSYPSGHTTIGMAVVIGLFLVTAYRWRGPVMFFTLAWGLSIGAATITASWHRLSDTIGADLVVLFFGGLAAIWLSRRGLIEKEPPKLYPLRTILVVFWAAFALLTFVIGMILLVRTLQIWEILPQLEAARAAGVAPNLTAHEDPTFQNNLYLASQSLASAFSTIAMLWFWGTFHRLSTAPAKGHRQ